ncbi:phytanoyl-CoA dioxygenase family protein [Haliea sp. E17]|uniref:phytanoyl-CoA dioxygenase family protein n=1 Tax=Haliea sp. E17 TaxID=3401576 RepID=UPI003AAB11EF
MSAIETLPAPTRDLATGLANLRDLGFTVVPEVLCGDALKRTRDALYRAAESDRMRGREIEQFALDIGDQSLTQRIWNVLSRDPLFEDLAEHPMALEYVRETIGWPALLGNISANICSPGCAGGHLHADQTFLAEPWPTTGPQGLNVAWAIDDFTEANGATRIVPGSHKLNRSVTVEEMGVGTVALEAPAGSMIVFESRLWHKTGVNSSQDQTRAGIFSWYTKTYVRTQENWFLALKPEIRQFASEEMLTLLGYKTYGFGLVNGVSPE